MTRVKQLIQLYCWKISKYPLVFIYLSIYLFIYLLLLFFVNFNWVLNLRYPDK